MKALKWIGIVSGSLVLLFIIIGIIAVATSDNEKPSATTSAVARLASSPDAVATQVKTGMTNPEVLAIIDIDDFTQNRSHVVISFSSVTVSGDTISYKQTKTIDSPYYGWLFFGTIVRDLNPALVIFDSDDKVISVSRISFDKAQAMVEWQSGKSFRR